MCIAVLWCAELSEDYEEAVHEQVSWTAEGPEGRRHGADSNWGFLEGIQKA